MNKWLHHLSVLCAALTCALSPGAELTPEEDAVAADLKALQQRVFAKVKAMQTSVQGLAPETAAYDALLEKYRGQPEAEITIMFYRVGFARSALRDDEDAKRWAERILREYPNNPRAELAQRTLRSMTPEVKAEIEAARAAFLAKCDALLNKPAPQLEILWSDSEGLKTLADLRGNVVVLDFWATWCGPCIASFPMVREEVDHFKGAPVAILGVTTLQGRVHGLESKPIDVKGDPAREYALTAQFKQKHDMTWPLVFATPNALSDYGVGGIPTIVIIAPDGTVRHVGLNPHKPGVDIAGKITAILKEFNLPVPPV